MTVDRMDAVKVSAALFDCHCGYRRLHRIYGLNRRSYFALAKHIRICAASNEDCVGSWRRVTEDVLNAVKSGERVGCRCLRSTIGPGARR